MCKASAKNVLEFHDVAIAVNAQIKFNYEKLSGCWLFDLMDL